MIPPIHLSEAFPYYRLPASSFEELCRDILEGLGDKESECYNYGKNGQAQDGIDAYLRFKTVTWTSQSKAYEEYKKKHLLEAKNKFLESIDHWKDFKVTRFIIFVGSAVVDKPLHDCLPSIKKEFQKHKIKLELWDSNRITKVLKEDFNDIADKHLGSYSSSCADLIIGRSTGDNSNTIPDDVFEQIKEDREENFHSIKKENREGRKVTAQNRLFSEITSPYWEHLPIELRSKIMSLRIQLLLNFVNDSDLALSEIVKHKSDFKDTELILSKARIALHNQDWSELSKLLPNPVTTNEIHIVAASLINRNKLGDAVTLLKAVSSPTEVTYYQLTIAYVIKKDTHKSLSYLSKALEISPNWNELNQLAGKLFYYMAFCECAPNWGNLFEPEPADLEFIKRDIASVGHLQKSLNYFDKVLELSQEKEFLAQSEIKYWRWNAILSLPEPNDEQLIEFKKTVEKTCDDHRFLKLIFHNFVEIDYGILLDSCKSEVEQNGYSSSLVLIKAKSLLQLEKFGDLKSLLKNHKRLFTEPHLKLEWSILFFQCAEFENDEHTMRKLIAEDKTGLLKQINSRHKKADGKQDVTLEEGYSPFDLYRYCSSLYQFREYELILEKKDEILSAMPIPKIVTLIAFCHFHLNQSRECIELLEDNVDLFYKSDYGDEVHRMMYECCKSLGKQYDAIPYLSKISPSNHTAYDKVELIASNLNIGNRPMAEAIANELLSLKSEQPHYLLKAAQLISPDSIEMGKRLLVKALDHEIEDPHLATSAIDLGFRLGEEKKVSGLYEIALNSNLSKEDAPLIALNIEDTLKMMEASKEATAKQLEAYKSGHAPVHIVAIGMNLRLFKLATMKSLDSSALPYFFQAASRFKSDKIQDGKDRVYLDITSLFTLYSLNLMPSILKGFDKIFISSNTISLIREEIQKLQNSHQISTIQSYKVVEGFLLDSRITKIHCEPNISINESLSAVAREYSLKVLSSSEKLNKDVAIITAEESVNEDIRDNILITISGLFSIESDKQLTDIIESNSLSILISESDEILQTLKVFRSDQAIIEELKRMISDISHLVSQGSYITTSSFEQKIESNDDIYMQHLCDTVDDSRNSDTLTCIDDRMLSRYKIIGDSQIVTSLHLIEHLLDKKIITKNKYKEILRELIKRNYRYIKIKKSVLLDWVLSNSSVSARSEGYSLEILRKYISKIAKDKDDFLRVIVDGTESLEQTELTYLLDFSTCIYDTIAEVWADPDLSYTEKVNISNYLVTSFSGVWNLLIDDEKTDSNISDLSMERLVHVACHLKEEDVENYLNWIYEWYGTRRVKWLSVLQHLKSGFIDLVSKHDSDQERIATFSLYQKIDRNLPHHLRADFQMTEEELACFDGVLYGTISIGEFNFKHSNLLDSITKSKSKPIKIQAINGEKDNFTISLKQNQTQVVFESDKHLEKFVFSDPSVALITVPDKKFKKLYSGAKLHLDMSSDEFETFVDTLYSIEDLENRANHLHEKQRNSFWHQMEYLFSRNEGSITLKEARPNSIEGILSHLYLTKNNNNEIHERLADGAERSVTAIGLQQTLHRYFALPYVIPDELVEQFDKLEDDARGKFINSHSGDNSSPLVKVHLFNLIQRSSVSEKPVILNKICESLYSEKTFISYKCLHSILRWSHSWIYAVCDEVQSEEDCILAYWIHAGSLYNELGGGDNKESSNRSFVDDSNKDIWINCLMDSSVGTDNLLYNPVMYDGGYLFFASLASISRWLKNPLCSIEPSSLITNIVKPYQDSDIYNPALYQYGTLKESSISKTVFQSFNNLFEVIDGVPNRSTIIEELNKVMTELLLSPNNTNQWQIYALLTRSYSLPEEVNKALLKVLPSVTFDIEKSDFNKIQMMGYCVFKLARNTAFRISTIDWEHLFELFVKEMDPIDSTAENYYGVVLEAAKDISFSSGANESESVKVFCRLVSKVKQFEDKHDRLSLCSILIKVAYNVRSSKPLWVLINQIRCS